MNLKTLEYVQRSKAAVCYAEAQKQSKILNTSLKALVAAKDKAGEFYRHFHYALFSYISHRIPEISDELYRIDDALMAGFGWEIGAFESWDVLGVAETAKAMKAAGYTVALWVDEMLATAIHHFIKQKIIQSCIMILPQKNTKPVPSAGNFIILENYKNKIVWKNNNAVAV